MEKKRPLNLTPVPRGEFNKRARELLRGAQEFIERLRKKQTPTDKDWTQQFTI